MSIPQEATWMIALLSAGGVVLRPWRVPDALAAVPGPAAARVAIGAGHRCDLCGAKAHSARLAATTDLARHRAAGLAAGRWRRRGWHRRGRDRVAGGVGARSAARPSNLHRRRCDPHRAVAME